MDPNDEEAWIGVSIVLSKNGEKQEAIRAAQNAVKCQNSNERPWVYLTKAHFDLNNTETLYQGNRSLKIALNLQPIYADKQLLYNMFKGWYPDKVDATLQPKQT